MSDYPMLISNKLHSFRNFWAQNYEKIWYLSTTSGSNLGLLTRKPKSLSHREYIYYQVFHLLADAPNCC